MQIEFGQYEWTRYFQVRATELNPIESYLPIGPRFLF